MQPEVEILEDGSVQTVTTGALGSLNKAEIDIQIETAHRYPRDLRTFKKRATEMATLDEETAQSCIYALPRGGKPIEGPSVRLAEIVVSTWGNLRAASRIVGEDGKFITAQATCHDLESNTAICVEVKRRITGKDGKRYKDDMVGVTANAASSIALRNAVFKVIPMAFTKEIYAAAKKVAIGDASTLASRRAKCVAAFGKMGVTEEQVCRVVGRQNIEAIGLDELATLQGLFTAIRNGDTTVDDAFPAPEIKKPQRKSTADKPKDADKHEPDPDAAPGEVTTEMIVEAWRLLGPTTARAALAEDMGLPKGKLTEKDLDGWSQDDLDKLWERIGAISA